ncbi:hypothetical protein NP234_24790, partial [Salmonella enterica]|nr:hypothetical protein [Salmonella enterica]
KEISQLDVKSRANTSSQSVTARLVVLQCQFWRCNASLLESVPCFDFKLRPEMPCSPFWLRAGIVVPELALQRQLSGCSSLKLAFWRFWSPPWPRAGAAAPTYWRKMTFRLSIRFLTHAWTEDWRCSAKNAAAAPKDGRLQI